jgi:hypothetical protein
LRLGGNDSEYPGVLDFISLIMDWMPIKLPSLPTFVSRNVGSVTLSICPTAAVAGILLSSGLSIFTPLAGFSYLLDGIAAVFIGASMHAQNRPNVPGTLIGVLFLATLGTGLDIIGIDFNLKAALKGIVLVLAIVLATVVSNRLPLVQAWFESTRKK